VAVPIGDGLDIIDAITFAVLDQVPVPGASPSFAAWSPDGRYVAVAGDGGYGSTFGQVTVFRTDHWLPVAFLGTGGRPCRPSFVPGSTRLIVSAGDSTVVLWDFAKGRVVHKYAFDGRPSIVAVSTAADFIAVGGQPTVYVYKTSGRLLRHFPDGLGAVSISPDGRRLLYTTASGETPPTYEVDLRTGRRHTRPDPEIVPDMLFYRKDGHSFVPLSQDYPENNVVPEWVKTVVKLAHADASTSRPVAGGAGYLSPLSHWPAGPSVRVGDWTTVPHAQGAASAADLSGYHLPGSIFAQMASPDHRYIAYVTAQHIDTADVVPIRVLDVQAGKLSPIPFPSTFDSRVVWSPDSRYVAVFDGGFDNVKGSTQHALYCWDVVNNKIRSIATAWIIDATWTSSGILKVEAGDEKSGGNTFLFDPATGEISPSARN